jgi:hypothetical protein
MYFRTPSQEAPTVIGAEKPRQSTYADGGGARNIRYACPKSAPNPLPDECGLYMRVQPAQSLIRPLSKSA